MQIRAIHDNIIFVFEDVVNTRGEFITQQDGSSAILRIATFDDSAKKPRWGIVIATGPECAKVQAGDRILIPALRWTAGVTFGNGKVWKTDESQLVGFSRDDKFELMNNYVIFSQHQPPPRQTSMMLIVVERDAPDNPTGSITQSSVDYLSVGDTIVYDGSMFDNMFTMANSTETAAFIKASDIIATKDPDE